MIKKPKIRIPAALYPQAGKHHDKKRELKNTPAIKANATWLRGYSSCQPNLLSPPVGSFGAVFISDYGLFPVNLLGSGNFSPACRHIYSIIEQSLLPIVWRPRKVDYSLCYGRCQFTSEIQSLLAKPQMPLQ